MEIWKDVIGAEGFYLVSSLGRIRSLHTVGRPADILKQTKNKKGYLRVGLSVRGKRVGRLVHRIVLDAFVGPQPSSIHECNHKDGNKSNNRKSNLEWVLPVENAAHAKRTGLWKPHIGEDHGRAKLNERKVHRILNLEGKQSAAEVGKRFGVSNTAIRLIWKGVNWKHVRKG